MPEREMAFAAAAAPPPRQRLCRQDEPKRIPLRSHPRCRNFGQARPASSRASCDDRTGQQAVHRLLPSAGSWVPQHRALEVLQLLRCSCRSAPHLTRPSAARQSLSRVAAAAAARGRCTSVCTAVRAPLALQSQSKGRRLRHGRRVRQRSKGRRRGDALASRWSELGVAALLLRAAAAAPPSPRPRAARCAPQLRTRSPPPCAGANGRGASPPPARDAPSASRPSLLPAPSRVAHVLQAHTLLAERRSTTNALRKRQIQSGP
jgi:hypothetical protein